MTGAEVYNKWQNSYGLGYSGFLDTTKFNQRIREATDNVLLQIYKEAERNDVVSKFLLPLKVTDLVLVPVSNFVRTVPTQILPNATPGTALSGTTTVTATILAGQTNPSIGDWVEFYIPAGYTLNGKKYGIFQVATTPTSTTFTLSGATGAGTNTGVIVMTNHYKLPYFKKLANLKAKITVSGVTYYETCTELNEAENIGPYKDGSPWFPLFRWETGGIKILGGTCSEIKISYYKTPSLSEATYIDATDSSTQIPYDADLLNRIILENVNLSSFTDRDQTMFQTSMIEQNINNQNT